MAIDEFEWQLNMCETENRQAYLETPSVEEHTADIEVAPDTTTRKSTNTLEEDVRILKEHYGEFTPAKLIEMDLDTACKLLHRDRHRSDAFSKLINYLFMEYQVCLSIVRSRKNRG